MTQLNGTVSQVIAWSLRQVILLVVLSGGAFTVSGQTSNAPEPDYSNVSDILNGQRTLLQDDDLIVTAFNPNGGLNRTPSLTGTIMNTANGKVSAVQPTSSGLNIGDDRIHKLFTGRFYQSDKDLVIRAVPTLIGSLPYLLVTDGSNLVAAPRLPNGAERDVTFSAAVGDFNGDGYADFAVNYGPGDETGKMVVYSGANSDGTKNLRFGPARTQADGQETLLAMTAGDFDGDGKMEIAGLAYKRNGKYVIVIYKVDPTTLAISKAAELVPSYTGEDTSQIIPYFSMASGHFTSATHNQVVLTYARTNSKVKIEVLDFAPGSLQPVEESIYQTASGFLPPGGFIQVETGRFNLTSPYDQIFFGFAWKELVSSPGQGTRYFQIFQVDPSNETLLSKSLVDFSEFTCASTFSVGNYDKQTTNSSGKTQPAFGLQVAVAGGACDTTSAKTLRIYGVNPVDYSSTTDYTATLPSTLNSATALYIDPVDLQGRSYVLGPPSKVVISESAQPSVIVATPPMHVDYITSVDGKGPQVLNLSAIPDGFYTTYETTSSEGNESSTTNTASWGFGAMVKVGASLEIGSVENGFGAKVSAAYSAAQQTKQVVETERGSYRSKDFSLRLQTKFSDHVWFTENRFNIYIYPVIGKTVCPADVGDNCPEPKPLTIQFSVPDDTKYNDIDADLIPWYQPPWEPGNVLSYPATYALLQQSVSVPLQKLSEDSTWRTDGSIREEQTTWTQQSTEGSSASFDQNYSTETELSVAGACCGGLVTGSVSAELNLSGSTGFSDLNKAVATLGKSTGIGIHKPGTFLTPFNYNYEVTPYIFGEQPPASKGDNTPSSADVQTSGMLRTAFVADPLATLSGGWWKQTYSGAPDVALNHPVRWDIVSTSLETPIPSNCRQSGSSSSTMDCADLQPRYPNNPFVSPFHIMRGFFITGASDSEKKGPQLSTAKAGDQLTLQTRVYNYSLAPMPAGSQVHVRFYAQPWNQNTHKAIGDSVLVNNADVVLNPIPPFSDGPGALLNWTLASTTFDTTPYANQYLTFWVVVWMEDSSGNLVPELSGHGLKAVPGTLKSIADIETETEKYSNNVGFYNSEFYVFPSEPALNAGSLEGEPAAINVGKIQLTATRALAGQVIDVSALLSATGNSASGLTAVFYDGDPQNGGTAFGLERSPYIAQDGTYQVLASYRAHTCGTHQLFIVVGQGTPGEIVRRAPPVRIDCVSDFLRHSNVQSR